MANILDLVAIIFIVFLSFVFCMSNNVNSSNNSTKNGYSCNLSYIVMGLSVIVFYKLAYYFKIKDKLNINMPMRIPIATPITMNKERFADNNELMNQFITGVSTDLIPLSQATSMTDDKYKEYSDQIQALTNSINQLSSQMTVSSSVAANPGNIDTMDLESQQQYQMFQIDYLNKQIKNAQDTLNANSVSSSAVNYKPIKVFSSCVVSNANGATTVDQPVSGSSSGHSQGLPLTPSSSLYASPASQTILNTVAQVPPSSSLSGSNNGFISMFLKNLV